MLFEFSFKVSRPWELYTAVPGFAVSLEVPDFRLQSRSSLRLEVIPDESRKQVYIVANDFWAAPRAYDVFLDRWHRVKVQFDTGSRSASVWMDNELLLGSVSLELEPITAAYGTLTISSQARAGTKIWIEDVEVRMAAPQAVSQDGQPRPAAEWIRLFLDDFESYGGNEGLLRQGGWVDLLRSAARGDDGAGLGKTAGPLSQLLGAYWTVRSGKGERGDFIVDGGDSMSGMQSLLMEKLENAKTVTTKIFSLPLKAPFGISERAFAIVDRDADIGPVRRQDSGALRRRGEYDRASRDTASDGQNPGIKVGGTSGTGGEMGVLSVSPTGTYYIYAFDGRLLAEYNGLGICVRDYIYMGGKLIAEYRPQESSYFYYASDQIGSTRIVTDGTGAVVYAAAHDPYGGIRKTWVPTYDPALKFSGKERDTESGLDYFGARYYDHSLYRFLSVDPIIPAGKAVSNPQRWNLYAYCLGNPVNYVDPDGADPFKFIITIERYGPQPDAQAMYSRLIVNGKTIGLTLENMAYLVPCGVYEGKLTKDGSRWVITLNRWEVIEIKGRNWVVQASIHAGVRASSIINCILVGKKVEEIGEISGSQEMMKELVQLVHTHQLAMQMFVDVAQKFLEQAAYASPLDMVYGVWAAFDAMSAMLDVYYSLMIEVQIRSAAN